RFLLNPVYVFGPVLQLADRPQRLPSTIRCASHPFLSGRWPQPKFHLEMSPCYATRRGVYDSLSRRGLSQGSSAGPTPPKRDAKSQDVRQRQSVPPSQGKCTSVQ